MIHASAYHVVNRNFGVNIATRNVSGTANTATIVTKLMERVYTAKDSNI